MSTEPEVRMVEHQNVSYMKDKYFGQFLNSHVIPTVCPTTLLADGSSRKRELHYLWVVPQVIALCNPLRHLDPKCSGKESNQEISCKILDCVWDLKKGINLM